MANPPSKTTNLHVKTSKTDTQTPANNAAERPERIAKVIARAGVASRREAERLIEQGRVSLNGKKLDSPAINVTLQDKILVNGRPLPEREDTQIWRFHKPRGCVTTHKDPEGRETAFDHLPEELGRVISVGRLDYNTEGLLLVTNDGGLARYLELPDTAWLRRYRVRARGAITQHKLDELKDGITIEGVKYGRIDAQLNRQDKANIWITVSIREGKNREIRRIFEALGLKVSRLIRISYGPFMLGDLASGQVEQIKSKILIEQLGSDIARELGISLETAHDGRRKGKQNNTKQGKEQLDNAIRSKKPGNPKGGKSLNFGKKKRSSRRFDDGEQDQEQGKRQRTGRRSRNAVRDHMKRTEKRSNATEGETGKEDNKRGSAGQFSRGKRSDSSARGKNKDNHRETGQSQRRGTDSKRQKSTRFGKK